MLFINFVPAIEVIFLNRNDSTEKRYFKQVCKSPEKLLGEEDFGAFLYALHGGYYSFFAKKLRIAFTTESVFCA